MKYFKRLTAMVAMLIATYPQLAFADVAVELISYDWRHLLDIICVIAIAAVGAKAGYYGKPAMYDGVMYFRTWADMPSSWAHIAISLGSGLLACLLFDLPVVLFPVPFIIGLVIAKINYNMPGNKEKGEANLAAIFFLDLAKEDGDEVALAYMQIASESMDENPDFMDTFDSMMEIYNQAREKHGLRRKTKDDLDIPWVVQNQMDNQSKS